MTKKKGRTITPMMPGPGAEKLKQRGTPFDEFDKEDLAKVPLEAFLGEFDKWQVRGDLLKAGYYVDETATPFPRIGDFESRVGLARIWSEIDTALQTAGFDPEGPTATNVALIVANAHGRLVEGRDQRSAAGKKSGRDRAMSVESRRQDLLEFLMEKRTAGLNPTNEQCGDFLEGIEEKRPSEGTVIGDRKALGLPYRPKRKKTKQTQ